MEEILKKRFELATHIQVELCGNKILVFFNFRNRRGLLAAV